MTTLKQTCLYAEHRAMGAKMMEFGGWHMPLNYGSQIDEHNHVRKDCGMFDVSHMRILDVKGEGARAFLRHLLANNVDKLTLPGKALYSCMLLDNGGVIDDLIVYFMNESWFRIVANADSADKDIDWMQQQAAEFKRHLPTGDAADALPFSAGGERSEGALDRGNASPHPNPDGTTSHSTFTPTRCANESSAGGVDGDGSRNRLLRSNVSQSLPASGQVAGHPPTGEEILITSHTELAMIAVQGPNARAKLWEALPGSKRFTENLAPFSSVEMGKMFIARTGYTGEDGFEIMLPAQAASFFWSALAGKGVKPVGLGARDTLRLEAGMNLYGHDMDENVSPLESGLAWTVDLKSGRDFIGKTALLANPPTRKLAGLLLLDRGVMRNQQKVQTPQGEGEITSGSFSPTLQRSIALARVPNDVQIGDTVQVAIRDKILDAQVVKYPFVRNGKGLI